MYAYLIPALLLLTVTPLAVRAEEPPAPPPEEEETTAQAADAEELPYGAGYEARQRAAQGEQQAQSREQTQVRERTEARATPAESRPARREADRAGAQRDARREARGQRPQRGPGGH
jgi:hypothetical protein